LSLNTVAIFYYKTGVEKVGEAEGAEGRGGKGTGTAGEMGEDGWWGRFCGSNLSIECLMKPEIAV
jgi:hypothetical protein